MNKIIQSKLLYPELLWERPVHYYKSQAGRVFVLAGSKKEAHEATVSCEAIFRSGTGILTLGFPDRLLPIYKEVLPEAMRLPLPSTLSDSLAKRGESQIIEQAKVCDVALLGPGLSTNAETVQLVWELIFQLKQPVVLDSDGIFGLIKGIEVLRTRETEEFMKEYFLKRGGELVIVVTPSELAKIINVAKFEGTKKITAEDIENKPEEYADLVAQSLKVTVVLKNFYTLVANSGGVVVTNFLGQKLPSLNSEVLSGIVASFIAQNTDKTLKAIITAGFLHDLALQKASQNYPEKTIKGSDVLRFLPRTIKEFE